MKQPSRHTVPTKRPCVCGLCILAARHPMQSHPMRLRVADVMHACNCACRHAQAATMDPAATHISNYNSGTPFYAAPEVASSGHASCASDLYRYELLIALHYRMCCFVCAWPSGFALCCAAGDVSMFLPVVPATMQQRCACGVNDAGGGCWWGGTAGLCEFLSSCGRARWKCERVSVAQTRACSCVGEL